MLSGSVRRLLTVLALAVGGWAVAMVLATTTASAEVDAGITPDAHAVCTGDYTDYSDYSDHSDHTREAESGLPHEYQGPDEPSCGNVTGAATPDPVESLHSDAEATTESRAPGTPATLVADVPTEDPTEDPTEEAIDEATDGAADEDGAPGCGRTIPGGDAALSPGPEAEGKAVHRTAPTPPTGPTDESRPEAGTEPARPLGQLLGGTLNGAVSSLSHTTEHLSGLLAGVLPKLTDGVGDVVDGVVELPSRLPGTQPGSGAELPEVALPGLPPDVVEILPVELGGGDRQQPDEAAGPAERPAGEPRAEPDATPRKASQQQPASPRATTASAAPQQDASWSSADTSEEAGTDRHSPRPFSPLPMSPSAPASAASASTTVALAHDNTTGSRGEPGMVADFPTPTQLRLLGTSRQHDVVGLGREAALPTTSPD